MDLRLEVWERTQRNFFTADRYEVRHSTRIVLGSPTVLIGCTVLNALERWMTENWPCPEGGSPPAQFRVHLLENTTATVFLPLLCTDRILSDTSNWIVEQTLFRRGTTATPIQPLLVILLSDT